VKPNAVLRTSTGREPTARLIKRILASTFDGLTKWIAFERLPDIPVIVTVVVAQDDIPARWPSRAPDERPRGQATDLRQRRFRDSHKSHADCFSGAPYDFAAAMGAAVRGQSEKKRIRDLVRVECRELGAGLGNIGYLALKGACAVDRDDPRVQRRRKRPPGIPSLILCFVP
jgi:hypothetical protein